MRIKKGNVLSVSDFGRLSNRSNVAGMIGRECIYAVNKKLSRNKKIKRYLIIQVGSPLQVAE